MLRYVSRRFLSVCEIPSLWRQFVWPHFHARDERCVVNVLERCGQYIHLASLPDHVTPFKIKTVLQHCSNLVELHLPTTVMTPDQLRMIIQPLEKLKRLFIPWMSLMVSEISADKSS